MKRMRSEREQKGPDKERKTLLSNLAMIQLAWKGSRAWVVCNMLDIIINPLRNLTIDVLLIGYIYNAVQESRPFHELTPLVILLCAFYFVNLVFEAVMLGFVNPAGNIRIQQYVDRLICSNAAAMPLASYDDASFYDNYVFSVRNCADTAKEAVQNLACLVAYSLGGVFGIGMIADIHPIMTVFVAASILISLLLASRRKELEFRFHEDISKVQVQEDFMHRVFYTKDYSKELRCLTPLPDFLIRRFVDIEERNTTLTKQYGRKKTAYGVFEVINNRVLMYWLVMALTVGLIALTGKIEPGNLLIMTVAVGTVSLLIGAIVGTIPQMGKIALFYGKLAAFLQEGVRETTQVHDTKTVLNDLESIRFEHVSFTYPNEGRAALTDVSFTVRKDERLVFVGENGSGKSTVIKLILGFYRPDAGRILVNGIDLEEVDLPSYRRLFGTVLQEVNLYAWSVEQNITLSQDSADAGKLRRVCKDSGLVGVLCAEEDLGSNMTREISEDGLVLSAGGRQRTAIARALYRDVAALLLDEITSAVDPETEAEIMRSIERAGTGKITVYISHKLSCVKNASHIILLEHGRVVEEGDHSSLIRAAGQYYSMFKAQAGQFARETHKRSLESEEWL